MKVGDLVRLTGNEARLRELPVGNVGVVVSKHWNFHGTECSFEIIIDGDLMHVHPKWVEVINESR